MKIIISGSRDWNYYGVFEKAVLDVLAEIQYNYPIKRKNIEIVQGGAHGVDYMARKFANKFKLTQTEFSANWDNLDETKEKVKVAYNTANGSGYPYNKLAGINRNIRMLDYINPAKYKFIAVFQMDKSKGAQFMVDAATKAHLPLYHFQINGNKISELTLSTHNIESIYIRKYK